VLGSKHQSAYHRTAPKEIRKRAPDPCLLARVLTAARAGRLGSGRLRANERWFAQVALSTALTWALAQALFGHPRPIFAGMGALIGVSATPGQRRRSAVETVLGVALGGALAGLTARRRSQLPMTNLPTRRCGLNHEKGEDTKEAPPAGTLTIAAMVEAATAAGRFELVESRDVALHAASP
jgi:fusaric acid resistance family protein